MRNLKRAFSLVLALVMALSVMTVAPVAAADETAPATVTSNFTDAAEIKYTEAVAITGGIGLFAGADGKFMPKGTVTRAQMATIIVKMLYGGDVNADGFKGSGKFIDTAYFEGGWAEGYINWCATLGIVAGYGDGTFKPGNQVTTAEAATMILNALKIDAGEGTWPNTVMAKAEEEDFFEDLKPMPGTNTALTREELAVIALNGLNWTSSDETGWYVSGGTADQKMTFESYKDAATYASKVGGQVQALEGRDSLANKVYELKKASGYITANQATGEKYTELTLDFAGPYTARFDVVTDASMIGHKVEVWYQETYTSEREPGVTYAVSEAAEYITLTEDAENTKEYKAAFGTKYDMPVGGIAVTNGTGYVAGGQTIGSYVANSYAPAGTYAIDIETGALCGYIAPASYTAAKVGFVDTTADMEQIMVGSLSLSNNAEDDKVVEYDGIAKDDYVVYYSLQDVVVLIKMDEVTGNVTKVGTKDGKTVVTLDGGKEYVESSAAGTISGTLGVNNLGSVDYAQVYTFYLDPNGNFVCYEAVEGGAFDMANTFYVLGVMSRDETDSYGKSTTTYFARGIDMTGNEAMVPIGIKKGAEPLVGTNDPIEPNFYSVEDAKGTEEKKENLKVLVAFPTAYNPDEPTATYSIQVSSYGQTGADWEPGGKFEFGVAEQFGGNGTLEPGVYCYNHKATKYIVVEGDADQSYPLESAVFTGSATFKFAYNTPFQLLLTRQTNGTNNIEAMVVPMNIDHGLNATMVYVDKYHTTPTGTDTIGNVYQVHDALTGEAKEITVSDTIDSIPVGFYSVGYDADEEIYKLAVDGEGTPIPVPAAASETQFEQRDRTDGRYFESVVYDLAMTAFNGSSIWTKLNSHSVSGTKVIDPRTDEQVANSGVARITTLDQVWAMKDSMPWVNIEMDMCHTYSPSKIVTIFVEVYNNREYGIGNLVYADSYNDTSVIVVDGQLDGMGKIISLPDGVVARKPGFYYLNANGDSVMLSAATDLDTVSKVALNGNVSGLNGYEIFNATDIAALDTLAGFADYEAVEYQLLDLEEKNTTVILVMGAGAKVASGNTAEKLVSSAEYDSVVDTTNNGITLENLESKQNALCIAYDAYQLNGDRMLMVATGTDAGTLVNTKTALDAISSASVTNTTDADFDTLAELKALVASGYTFSAKLYELPGGDVLVVSMCMNAAAVDGALSAGSFASDKVVLSGDATLSGTITVPAGEKWLLDLNGKTLSGSAAPYFIISAGAELTIQDSGNGGKVQGTQGADAMFKVEGDLILNSGELSGHENTNAAVYGGAIHLNKKGASFTMNGGVIRDNKSAGRGGAIGAQDGLNGTYITINGGEIVDNIADRGNNIYTQSVVYFTMTGGTIGKGLELDGSVATTENLWMRNTTIEITGAPKITGLGPDSTCTMNLANLADGAYIEMTRTDAVVTKDATVDQSGNIYTNSAAAGAGLNFKVVQPANGTITLSPASAELGDTVTITATPDTGYELKAIYVDGNAISGTTITVTKEHRITAEFQPVEYTVTKGAETNGTFTVSPTTAAYGDTITVTTSPASSYATESVKVNGEELPGTGNTYTFTMPAEDVIVTVTFGQPQYAINKAAATNGSFTVSATKAVEGATITITPTPADGYEVDAVTVNGNAATASGKNYTFTMPGEAVEVKVTFKVEVLNNVAAANFVAGQTLTLTKNSKLTGAVNLTAAGTYTLDLNGYTLSGAATPYFTVGSGVTLVIKDSGTDGNVKGLASATDSMFKVNAGGQLTLQSGTLTGNTGAANGGAVNVNGGKFVMSGGTISNNSTTAYGGAIFLAKNDSSSTFEMKGGIITGNKSAKGGAISTQEHADANATISLTNGTITGNDATGRGATMHLFDAVVTISGGKYGWGFVNGSAAAASHAETEFRANCVVTIENAEMDQVGTQGYPWDVTIKGNTKIDSLMLVGANAANKCSIVELTDGAQVKLGAATPAGVVFTTDSTVKVTGTSGAANSVYTKQ